VRPQLGYFDAQPVKTPLCWHSRDLIYRTMSQPPLAEDDSLWRTIRPFALATVAARQDKSRPLTFLNEHVAVPESLWQARRDFLMPSCTGS
jgi:hypothetical protein